MSILYFLVSLISTTIGAVGGIGGGVIIKPVLDATGTLNVTTISFLSGCTVLAMAIVSLIRNRKSEVTIDLKNTTFLGLGAAFGGIIGKYLFGVIKNIAQNDNLVGLIQSTTLLIITVFIFLFVTFKHKIKMLNIKNVLVSLLIGLLLGLISAFLGIGGGPINIAVLYFFFSMAPKTAALNSIYVILISQSASLIFALGTNSVPVFEPLVLVLMMIGGILGGLLGSEIVKKISQKQVDNLFKYVMIFIMLININNIVMFA